jgi:pimeloyl-ACP methyl ester carboxylesterase
MRVRVGDARIHFEVIGERLVPEGPTLRERPTMILLHGGPGFDHNSLRPGLAPLADVAQLVFLDHRGQGRSDESTPDRWNLDTWIDDVAGFCDVLGIDQPILFGHSFGGMVALGVAIRHPKLPGKLVVSNSAAKFRPDRALEMFERLGGEEARAVAADYFAMPTEERLERFMEVCFPLYGIVPPDPGAPRAHRRATGRRHPLLRGRDQRVRLVPRTCTNCLSHPDPRRRARSDHAGRRARGDGRGHSRSEARGLREGRPRTVARSPRGDARAHSHIRDHAAGPVDMTPRGCA